MDQIIDFSANGVFINDSMQQLPLLNQNNIVSLREVQCINRIFTAIKSCTFFSVLEIRNNEGEYLLSGPQRPRFQDRRRWDLWGVLIEGKLIWEPHHDIHDLISGKKSITLRE